MGLNRTTVLALSAGVIILAALAFSFGGPKTMEQERQTIESLQTDYQDQLMGIDGIVAVSIGLCEDGSPCLTIGTSKPVEEIKDALPEALQRDDVRIEFMGEIRSQ